MRPSPARAGGLATAARRARVSRLGRLALLAALALPMAWLAGCAQLGYYGQSLSGHLALLRAAEPVPDWLAKPDLDPALRRQLELSQSLRRFASEALKLPDNDSYRRYADLKRPAAVWNVVATPELSLNLQTWCYPVMGCAGYRGYFRREDAQALADELRGQGQEVYVYGVPAYSSLGWSNWLGGDPLLSTFIHDPEAQLARMIFHELAHQVAYAADDTTFNESFATAVERLGLERWLAGRPEVLAQDRQSRERWVALQGVLAGTRQRLRELYASPQPDEAKRAAKAQALAQLRNDYAQLRDRDWAGDTRFDRWVAGLNNPALAIQGSYNDLVPDFERLFRRLDGDWTRFYAEVRRLAALPKAQRRLELQRQEQ